MPLSPDLFDWAREIKPELLQLDSIPLTGAAPPFPWEELGNRLSQSLEKEGIKIVPGEIAWRSKEHLYEGLGDSPFPLTLAIPSLQGSICWVMPEQEMASLESFILTKSSDPINFQDRSLSQAFYRFFALEVLYQFSQLSFDKTLTPILTAQHELPNEDSLCWDISIVTQGHSLWGRLIIAPDLRRSWVEHFAKKHASSSLSQALAKKVSVPLHLEAGKIKLSYKQWSHVQLGDWIAFDQCYLNPSDLKQGNVMLTIQGRNAYWGELQEGHVKIVDFSQYQEVHIPMPTNHEENDEDLDELTGSEDLELDDESTFATDADFLDEEDFEETETSVPPPVRNPKPEADATIVEEVQEAEVAQELDVAIPKVETETSEPIKPGEIPVSLIVEIGRVQMTMDKLLNLEPGNLLELNVHPENGLDLVINGKLVGKGELVRLGEALGIRIIELGG